MAEQVTMLAEITNEMADLAEAVELAESTAELASDMYEIFQDKLMEAQQAAAQAAKDYYQSLRDLDAAKDRLSVAARRYGVTVDAEGNWS